MANTDVLALQELYVALGGDADDVASITTTVDMLKKIYELKGGEDDVTKINTSSDMIIKIGDVIASASIAVTPTTDASVEQPGSTSGSTDPV